jgi:hypothetical protein
MANEGQRHVGLSRRELERELAWMLRHVPTDPVQLAKLIGQIVVTLIDKNNAALACRIDAMDDGKPGDS